jgi:hypothetical protein
MDFLGPLTSISEKVFGDRARRQAADRRVADRALHMRRELAASFEDWPAGPRTLEDLVRWGIKLSRGFAATDASLASLVEPSADASRKARRAVTKARDEYYAVANLVNPLMRSVNIEIKRPWETAEAATIEGPLRRAWAHMRPCLAALDAASGVGD